MAFVGLLCALLVVCASAERPALAALRAKKLPIRSEGRRLIPCGDWDSCDNSAHVCRKVKKDAPAKECADPAKLGEWCDNSDQCDKETRCVEEACAPLGVAGESCGGWGEKHCAADLYCGGDTCAALKAVGAECSEDKQCKESYCNVEGGVGACKSYTKEGGACLSDKECGGDDISGGLHYHCDDGSKTCQELGKQVGQAVEAAAGFFARLGAAIIGIIVAVVVIIILLIYFCCCRKRSTVVVVNQ